MYSVPHFNAKTLTSTYQGYCVRLPPSNSPVTDVTSTDIRCNVNGLTGIANKCTVAAGGTVTVEMHQVYLHPTAIE